MADTEYWTVPADAYVRGGGEYTITVLTPPYQVDSGRLPANDAVAARQFAEAFPTVEEVLEVLPDAPANEGLYLTTRTDLDLIRVGVWGNVIGISDPALIDDGTRFTMASETATVAERCPDARVVGRLAVDCGEDYTEDIARLPDGSRLHAGGYPGTEPWEVHGTPRGLLTALGLSPADPEAHGVQWTDDPARMNWSDLCNLALGKANPWVWPLPMSVFRVRHTEEATGIMEDSWFIGS